MFMPVKLIVFSADGIARQHYELRKLRRALRMEVTQLSEGHVKPHERASLPN
jgi:hypothetical protein